MPVIVDTKELPALLREFANYKSAIQGCSQKTVNEYLLDLRTFLRYMYAVREGISLESEEFAEIDIIGIDINFIKTISTEDIYEFLMYSGTVRKNLWSAKARKLSAIKAFYKYLTLKRHLMDDNPAINIESPKAKKTLPKFLTLEESLHLLDTVRSDVRSRNVIRDYTIITLFLNCGMRVSELAGLNLSDIDSEYRSLRVIGKGAKERMIYLNEACRAVLSEYIPYRVSGEKFKNVTDNALFLSEQEKRMGVPSIQWMVKKYLAMAGFESRHLSVHKLRHTAATLMYQTGEVDVRVLKDILGHEQLNTTQIYTHVSDVHMKDAMEQNPLSKIKPE